LKSIDAIETTVYEDDEYKILKTSHGEWGGMAYFIEKIRKKSLERSLMMLLMS
jgi:hypothetical protein